MTAKDDVPADYVPELLPRLVRELLYPRYFYDEIVAESKKHGADPRLVLACLMIPASVGWAKSTSRQRILDHVTVKNFGVQSPRSQSNSIRMQGGSGYSIIRGCRVDVSGGRAIWTENSSTRYIVVGNTTTLTTGETEFSETAKLQREGRKDDAIRAFESLIARYPRTWIDTVSRARLAELRK